MKVNDILQQLADFVNNHRSGEQPERDVQTNAEGQELAREPEDLFVPPLQQKIELLKKAVGVENIYDEDQQAKAEEEAEANRVTPEEEDELARMKRAAGIPAAAVIQELSNDEVFDD
jgi:hypothetical protein